MAVSRSVLRSYRSLTMVVIALGAFGCERGDEGKANTLMSEAMAAIDQAKEVMSAVEGGDLNAPSLDAWIHLTEAYDLLTEIGERYPDTHIAAALATSDSADRTSPTTVGSRTRPVRERVHETALRSLALAVNRDTGVEAWEDACPKAPSEAWALVCVTAWVLSETSEASRTPEAPSTRLDISALVAHGHGRNALRHVRQLDSEDVRRTALTSLAGALAWANNAELALEAADAVAELGGSWGVAREEVVRAQATTGDIEGVLVTLDHLGPGVATLRTRSAIAEALARLDDAGQRRRVLDRVLPFISSRARDEFLGTVAVAVAQAGDIGAAQEITDRIPEPDVVERGRVLAGIAAAQSAAGDRAGARRVLRSATDMVAAFEPSTRQEQGRRVAASGALAGAWVRAGDRETAFSLASDVSSQDSLDILRPIARALSTEGDLSQALEVAESLVESTLAW